MAAEYRIIDRAHRVIRAEALLKSGARLGTILALTGLSEGLVREIREELGIKTRKGANPAASRFYMGSNDARLRASAFYGIVRSLEAEMQESGTVCLSELLLRGVDLFNKFMTKKYSIDRAYYLWYYVQNGSFSVGKCDRCKENFFLYNSDCPPRAMRACPSCLYSEFRHSDRVEEQVLQDDEMAMV